MKRDETHLLAQMTTVEAGDRLNKAKLAIIPVGSTEQHSQNMTMETDIVLAVELSKQLAERIAPLAVIAPPIPVGISYHHMDFAGSMTLQPATLHAVLTDYIKSLKRHGIKRFLLLNGHGGNQQTLSVFSTMARHELDVQIANLFYWNLAAQEIREEAVSERYGHACEIETSFGLHLAPHIVRKDTLRSSDMLDYPFRYTGNEPGPKVDVPYTFAELTVDGSFGDARAATPEKGKKLIELILYRLMDFTKDFISNEIKGEEYENK